MVVGKHSGDHPAKASGSHVTQFSTTASAKSFTLYIATLILVQVKNFPIHCKLKDENVEQLVGLPGQACMYRSIATMQSRKRICTVIIIIGVQGTCSCSTQQIGKGTPIYTCNPYYPPPCSEGNHSVIYHAVALSFSILSAAVNTFLMAHKCTHPHVHTRTHSCRHAWVDQIIGG